MKLVEPAMGQWYLDRRTGRLFEVISVDETVELQDYNGNLDEIERRIWSTLDLESADPPEDFLDVFENEDSDGEDKFRVNHEH